MTAADYLALSAELADATLRVEGVTEYARLRGLTFDPDAPVTRPAPPRQRAGHRNK